MCAEYMLVTTQKNIQDGLYLNIRNDHNLPDFWDLHVRMYSHAPVITINAGEAQFRDMQFSLLPPGTPFPTFNARLASWDEKKNKLVKIYEKPTWKNPFAHSPCLIPMTGFIEPIYVGEYAGNAMEFKGANDPILYAAGLWAENTNKRTGEIYDGFTPILHTPSDFVVKIGHHRMLILLRPEAAVKWLLETMTIESRYEFILNNRYIPDLFAQSSRVLAKGWEKRVTENKTKHESELEFIKKFMA
jgi:putative SOS response-associated peptidase YedK